VDFLSDSSFSGFGPVRYKLLDLYCCAGGASGGYAAAGFCVTGVDIRSQRRYPYSFIQADALEILRDREFCQEFQAIHASPPCQLHTSLNHLMRAQGKKHHDRDYIAETRELLDEWALETGGLYVIENVPQAPLLKSHSVTLCGTMFNLELWGRDLVRHRTFESNIFLPRPENHSHRGRSWGVYGSLNSSIAGGSETPPNLDAARRLMGIDWMLWRELREAIPPAYTQYIGGYLIQSLESARECLLTRTAPAPSTSSTGLVLSG
jgi:DNA (cytosine-5)-methyltransferase 1